MRSDLAPLLDVLGQPETPAFEQALVQLAAFSPTGLSTAEATALLATIDQVLATLQNQRHAAVSELNRLRSQLKAAGAYRGQP
ncbi:MAG: hypothetical protein INF43_00990 [Alphaproteobacteria bacterium]|jgi:hypothetical protein|nr:hypothetical protein [Alphaproteobacteria bacterium]